MKKICNCIECNNAILESDLAEVIEQGTTKDGFTAEDGNINIYKCSKCGSNTYAGGELEHMNKKQFNALALEQQVAYINEQLESTSLTKACASVTLDRATIRKRFGKIGYEFNKECNQYKTTGETTVTTKTIKKSTDNKQEKSKGNNNTKLLENRVTSLEQELEQLKAMVLGNTNNTTNTIGTTDTNNTGIKTFESDNLVSRNYKIDRAVADKFVKFCKVQKLTNDYKVSDLATNALIEYMDKYKEV